MAPDPSVSGRTCCILSNRTNPIDHACVVWNVSLLLRERERVDDTGEERERGGGTWYSPVQFRPVSVRWEVAVKAAQARLALPPPRLPGSMPALHSIRCDVASSDFFEELLSSSATCPVGPPSLVPCRTWPGLASRVRRTQPRPIGLCCVECSSLLCSPPWWLLQMGTVNARVRVA
jgi:hypothetical protein